MTPVFVDTGALAALAHRDDQNHPAARRCLKRLARERRPLVTSTYVLDELFTLLRFRWNHATAVAFGESLARSRWCRTLDIDEATRQTAWQLFASHADQTFSFTDCTSFALMRELDLREAFAFDHHFAAAGFVCLPA